MENITSFNIYSDKGDHLIDVHSKTVRHTVLNTRYRELQNWTKKWMISYRRAIIMDNVMFRKRNNVITKE